MAKPPRTAISGTFFVAANTLERRRRFRVDANAQLFLKTLQRYRAEGHYNSTPLSSCRTTSISCCPRQDIPKAMGYIKGGSSYRLASNFPVWQPGFTDHLVKTREEFESRRTYIHENPVRAGLVERPEDYRYSSAYRGRS